ncbi:MAG: ABC transporter permease [Clostridiaceae bacterium]|nr:ABC transporter permease [Clostridiaceae bacterium]
MTVYKAFLQLTWRKKIIIIPIVGIFLAISIIITVTVQEKQSFEDVSLKIGLVDHSESELSRDLISYLESGNQVHLIDADATEQKRGIFNDRYDLTMTIYENLEQNVLSGQKAVGMIKNRQSAQAYFGEMKVQKFLLFSKAAYENGKFDTARVREALTADSEIQFLAADQAETENYVLVYFSSGAYIFSLLIFLAVGMVMADFGDEQLQLRNEVSGKSKLSFQQELLLGQITLLVISLLPIMLYPLVPGGNMTRIYLEHLGPIVLNVALLCVAILSIFNFIYSLSQKHTTISAVGNVLSMGFGFISGGMVPREFLPDISLILARFFPIYYYININEAIYQPDFTWGEILPDILIQLGFTCGFFALNLLVRHLKQKQWRAVKN